MPRLLTSLILSLFLVACASRSTTAGQPAAGAAKADVPLKVMTYNLRYASPKPPHSWPERRPVSKAMLHEYKPDLVGTQEGVYQQLKDIAADNPDYEWLGVGRDGGSRGEFMAVFYLRDRFEPLEYDHFWLSDTPSVIASSTWGNTCRRMVTWVRFRDLKSNQQFYFINTHLDHEVQAAREKGAKLILERINGLKPELPVLLVGDFNAEQDNPVYKSMTAPGAMSDTWYAATKRINEKTNSMHNYKTPIQEGKRIDWIMSRGPFAVDSSEVVTFAKNGQTPSDHFPVVASVRMLAAPTTRPAK